MNSETLERIADILYKRETHIAGGAPNLETGLSRFERTVLYKDVIGQILAAIREAAKEGMQQNPHKLAWSDLVYPPIREEADMRALLWEMGYQACIDRLKPNANQTSSG